MVPALNHQRFVMDNSLEPDYHFQFEQLTDHPTTDFHLRAGEHKTEELLWLNGARYRMIGVRDVEPDAPNRDRLHHEAESGPR
jgi:hypothetical protein